MIFDRTPKEHANQGYNRIGLALKEMNDLDQIINEVKKEKKGD